MVLATMNYGDPLDPQNFPVKYTPVEVNVYNGRAAGNVCSDASNLMSSLEQTGFTLVTLPPPVEPAALFEPVTVQETYMAFVQEYLLRATGCDEVMPINFVHRKSGKGTALPEGFTQNVPKSRLGDSAPEERVKPDADDQFTGAIGNVHSDYSDDCLLVQLLRQRAIDEEKAELGGSGLLAQSLQGSNVGGASRENSRFVLFNCWRPLVTAQRWPLAVCDATSIVDSEDLYTRATPENNNKVLNCFPARAKAGKHRWVYYPNMNTNEMLIFKAWDEDSSGRSYLERGVINQTLHSAFDCPAPASAPIRQSLEARFACIWNKKNHVAEKSRL